MFHQLDQLLPWHPPVGQHEPAQPNDDKKPGEGCREVFKVGKPRFGGEQLSSLFSGGIKTPEAFFFSPSDSQRILLFSSSFSCFRRVFSSSKSEIRYGTRQRINCGLRVGTSAEGWHFPGWRQGALCKLVLLVKRSVPLCFASYPLQNRSWRERELRCHNRDWLFCPFSFSLKLMFSVES